MWKRKHAEQKQIEKNEKSSGEIKRKACILRSSFLPLDEKAERIINPQA